jgi:LysR family nitrogen assimilation transcriptional regulator
MLLLVGGKVGTIVPGSAIAGRPDLYAYAIKPEIRRRASLAHSTAAPLSAASEQVHAIMVETVMELVKTGRWLGATLC